MPAPDRPRLPLYEPPIGDAPLDAVQQSLVRMWVDIIVAEMEAEAAAQAAAPKSVSPARRRA